jgi:hypothetical protein
MTWSGRRCAGTARAGWRRRHDLSGKSAADGYHDQRPLSSADREGPSVCLLKDAQDIGHRVGVAWSGPPPAQDDPLTDVSRREPDL